MKNKIIVNKTDILTLLEKAETREWELSPAVNSYTKQSPTYQAGYYQGCIDVLRDLLKMNVTSNNMAKMERLKNRIIVYCSKCYQQLTKKEREYYSIEQQFSSKMYCEKHRK